MKITICDCNTRLIAAFARHVWPSDQLVCADITSMTADAVVSPANSFGFMDGGVDYAYSMMFGWGLQARLQEEIAKLPFGELLVGHALVIPTGHATIPYLISAPTMRVPKRITDPADVMLATRAAVRAALDAKLSSIVFPGMGTGCGELPVDIAARAMMAGIDAGLNGAVKPRSWREAQCRHFALAGIA